MVAWFAWALSLLRTGLDVALGLSRFRIVPQWDGSQCRVWQAGVDHGQRLFRFELDLRARPENGDAQARTITGVTLCLKPGRLFRRPIAFADDAQYWPADTSARIMRTFRDHGSPGIRVEANTVGAPHYLVFRALLPRGVSRLSHGHVAIITFTIVGRHRLKLKIPVRCDEPNQTMGFSDPPSH